MMIVDDSIVMRRMINRSPMMKQMSTIIQASNGVDAINKYKDYKPDVISMDLTIPHMDGVQCVKNLKQLNPDINILVISAMKDKSMVLRAIESGARGFLPKPFTEQQLNHALGLMISRIS